MVRRPASSVVSVVSSTSVFSCPIKADGCGVSGPSVPRSIVEDHINSKFFIHPSYCHPCSHQRLHFEPRNNRNLPLQPSGKEICRGSSLSSCIASCSTREDAQQRSAHRAERRVAHQSHRSPAFPPFCRLSVPVEHRLTQ
jgi:hypothetical protein